MESIYEIMSRVVADGQYTEEEIQRRLAKLFGRGQLTEEEYDGLCSAAKPDPGYHPPGDYKPEIEAVRMELERVSEAAMEDIAAAFLRIKAADACLTAAVERLAEAGVPVNTSGEWEPGKTYLAGDTVSHGGGTYRCIQGHATQEGWTPDNLPALWKKHPAPAEDWPEWVQPLGSEDAYPLGAKVSWGGKRWTSERDANVWEPGAQDSGWTEAA